MQRMMCVYMPYMATDLAGSSVRPPADPQGPLILTRRSGAAVFVAHACPHALAAGVLPGMPLGEARAILPQAQVAPHEPRQDAATLEHLALWAQQFSPLVQSAAPEALVLNVSGCARLFGGEANIVRQVVAGLAAKNIRARAAIADTVGAAWALAHAGPQREMVADSGRAVPALVNLPPAVLRLEDRTVQMLDALGVRSIGDLLMLPRATLPSRFGEYLVLRLRQMLGEVPEPIGLPKQAPVYSAGMPFGPTDKPEVVAAALERMVTRLCERLAAGDAAARRVLCAVYFQDRQPFSSWTGLSRPSRNAGHLRALLSVHIEKVDLSPGATGLRVMAMETSPWHPRQGELFEPPKRTDDEATGTLVDRLVNHLGHGAVVRAEAVEDHQPERAVGYVAVVEEMQNGRRDEGTGGRRNRGTKGPGEEYSERGTDFEVGAVPDRPLRLLDRPRPVRAMALVPDGPPKWFADRGHEYVVVRSAGPERVETGWWRGPDVGRDYFRVLTACGRQFWLFRDLKTSQWHVHGSFE